MQKRKWVQAGVVALLLLLCAGVLLPGVSKVRNAADRASCQNNLKQIVFAVENYADSHGHYPTGAMPNPDLPPDRRMSWLFRIVPYVEATDIYHRTDHSTAWDAEQNRQWTNVSFRVYTCPGIGDQESHIGSYFGMAGLEPDAATLPVKDPRAGMFGYDRETRLDDITDGTSNTVLMIESPSAGPWAQGGPSTVRGVDPNSRPHVGPGRLFNGHPYEFRWFSRAVRGANAIMADGSVRMIRETAAPEVLEALSTIAGKEEVPAEEW